MPRVSDSRTRLLDTAAQLLWAQGYHGTGLNQIIQESGAPKGSLYFLFPGGKEQLCVEALREATTRMTDSITKIFGRNSSPASALRDFSTSFAKRLESSDFRHGCPVATVTLEAASESEALREVCKQAYADWHRVIADNLRTAGYRRADADGMATLVLSAIEGGLILSRAKRSVSPLRVLTSQIAKLL